MSNKASHHYIDGLIESTERHWAWNYFVTQTMHLALALIGEAIPGSASGLILPLQRKRILSTLPFPEDLPKVGRSLVGWVAENGSQHVFLASPPQFTYADDYHIERLSKIQGPTSKDDPLLVMPRQIDSDGIESGVVEIIRFLLDFIYQYQEDWYGHFRRQARDAFTPINTSHNGSFSSDPLLNNLMNIIICLGGSTHGQDRWRFCCVLLPQESRLPPQQNCLSMLKVKMPHIR